MKSEDERKWFDFHGIQPELAELYRYFDRTFSKNKCDF